jgi:hypothetical protein
MWPDRDDPEFTGYYQPIAHMKDTLDHYVLKGIPMGDFLTACFANDLMEAMGRADDRNRPLVFLFCQWIYNVAPGRCHGSRELVRAWIEKRGLEGKVENKETISEASA